MKVKLLTHAHDTTRMTKAARQEKCENRSNVFSWKLTHARDTTWHDTKRARQKKARHFRIGPKKFVV